MRQIDVFSEKLDKIFSDKCPTKAQILDAYIKSNPDSHEQVKIRSKSDFSQRIELYFAFMEEYNALMGESEHQILKEEVVVLLAKYCA